MITVLRVKKIRTRKDRQCFACLRQFKTGSNMVSITCAEGGIWTIYQCETCRELFDLYPDSLLNNDGIFDEGCVADAISQIPLVDTPEELLAFWGED